MKTKTKLKLKKMLVSITPKDDREDLLLEDNAEIAQSIEMIAAQIGTLNQRNEKFEKDIIHYVERSIEKAKGNILDDFEEHKDSIGQKFEKLKDLYDTYDKKSSSRTEVISKGLQKEIRDQIESLYKDIAGLSNKVGNIRPTTWGGASIITYLYGQTISPQNLYNQINWIFGSGFSVTAVNNNQAQRVDVTVAVTGGGGGGGFAYFNEVPSGVIDGVNTVFTLAHTPSAPDAMLLFLNGSLQYNNASGDYTVSGDTITFTSPPFPSGSTLLAWYS